jgi:hypothetical protein
MSPQCRVLSCVSALASLVLAAGCDAPLPEHAVQRQQDRALYAEVMASLGPKAAQNLPLCRQISDADLAGDCALHAVRNEARGDRSGAEQWCPELPTGAWRDECFFMAADTIGARGQLSDARSLCHQAGSFRQSCYRHQLQTELRRLVHEDHDQELGELERRMAQARSRWQVHANTQGTSRAWTHFFSEVFEARREAAPELCAAVSERRRGWCREGAREARIRPG